MERTALWCAGGVLVNVSQQALCKKTQVHTYAFTHTELRYIAEKMGV